MNLSSDLVRGPPPAAHQHHPMRSNLLHHSGSLDLSLRATPTPPSASPSHEDISSPSTSDLTTPAPMDLSRYANLSLLFNHVPTYNKCSKLLRPGFFFTQIILCPFFKIK